jgi:hypothetical protein
VNFYVDDIKTKIRAKCGIGDISCSPSDQDWLIACIDVAYLNGRASKMDEACDRMQTQIDRLEKHAGNGGI